MSKEFFMDDIKERIISDIRAHIDELIDKYGREYPPALRSELLILLEGILHAEAQKLWDRAYGIKRD